MTLSDQQVILVQARKMASLEVELSLALAAADEARALGEWAAAERDRALTAGGV